MLSRWPVEFIHAVTTEAGVGWPCAMFSAHPPTPMPAAESRPPGDDALGRVVVEVAALVHVERVLEGDLGHGVVPGQRGEAAARALEVDESRDLLPVRELGRRHRHPGGVRPAPAAPVIPPVARQAEVRRPRSEGVATRRPKQRSASRRRRDMELSGGRCTSPFDRIRPGAEASARAPPGRGPGARPGTARPRGPGRPRRGRRPSGASRAARSASASAAGSSGGTRRPAAAPVEGLGHAADARRDDRDARPPSPRGARGAGPPGARGARATSAAPRQRHGSLRQPAKRTEPGRAARAAASRPARLAPSPTSTSTPRGSARRDPGVDEGAVALLGAQPAEREDARLVRGEAPTRRGPRRAPPPPRARRPPRRCRSRRRGCGPGSTPERARASRTDGVTATTASADRRQRRSHASKKRIFRFSAV